MCQQNNQCEIQEKLFNDFKREIEAKTLNKIVESSSNHKIQELEQKRYRSDFIDLLVRSPELRTSPVGFENILAYDRTVHQLYHNQHQHQQEQAEQQQQNQTIKRLIRQEHFDESLDQKKNFDENVSENDAYVKIAVGELIHAFEQQTIQQQQQTMNIKRTENISFLNKSLQKEKSQAEKITPDQNISELYVPPEIPLEYYAPPPAVPSVLANPTSSLPTYDSSPYMEPVQNTTQNTWSPKPSMGTNTATYQAPKQKILSPSSYQKNNTTFATQQSPSVNYTPSPLPQKKYLKFLQPSMNTSPEPWAKNYEQSVSKSIDFLRKPVVSPSLPKQRFSGTSFNNSARGWQQFPAKPQLYGVSAPSQNAAGWNNVDLPYTDF